MQFWQDSLRKNGEYRIELSASAGSADDAFRLLVGVSQPAYTVERVADILKGSEPSGPTYMTEFNGKLVFTAEGGDGAGRELYDYNGTQVRRVTNIAGTLKGSRPSYMTVYSGALYFSALSDDGAGTELWEFDGAAPPTRLTDIWPGEDDSSPVCLTVFNDILYFAANAGEDFGAGQLWQYDSVTNTADRVATATIDHSHLGVFHDKLYYSAVEPFDNYVRYELYEHDGTNGRLAIDLDSGRFENFPSALTVYRDALFFIARDRDEPGFELWKYDGAQATLVADFPGVPIIQMPKNIVVYNDVLYFSADGRDGAGMELRQYDAVTVSLAADIRPGTEGSGPEYLAVYNDWLYFSADGGDGAGKELWRFKSKEP